MDNRIPLPDSGQAIELLDACDVDCLCDPADGIHYRALPDMETP